MAEKVTKLAVASRVIVLIFQFLSNLAIIDHKPDVFRSPVAGHGQSSPTTSSSHLYLSNSGNLNATTIKDGVVFQSPTWLDRMVDFCLGGLRHWDGEYFLHIAEHTYSYENTLAFYPLYPILVGSGARVLDYFSLGLSLRSCTLITAVLINLFCFCKATNTLYDLTQRVFKDPNKSWYAALLFCFNPASIFFTAAYSETLYAWLSLQLMLECVSELRFIRYVFTLACSIICRSNGLVNAGFPIYFLLRRWILCPAYNGLVQMFKICFMLIFALIPLTFFYSYAFQQFCLQERTMPLTSAIVDYARERNYILAGHRQPHQSPWCDQTFLFPYSYIQSHYWNVGFLRYYELKQLPNFLLALPVLGFLYYNCWKYFSNFSGIILKRYPLKQILKDYESLPFVMHALFLIIFCTLFVHIQISTRLLCSASPCLYWFAADHMPKSLYQLRWRSKAGIILLWFGSYYLVGTALFSNNLPWT